MCIEKARESVYSICTWNGSITIINGWPALGNKHSDLSKVLSRRETFIRLPRVPYVILCGPVQGFRCFNENTLKQMFNCCQLTGWKNIKCHCTFIPSSGTCSSLLVKSNTSKKSLFLELKYNLVKIYILFCLLDHCKITLDAHFSREIFHSWFSEAKLLRILTTPFISSEMRFFLTHGNLRIQQLYHWQNITF